VLKQMTAAPTVGRCGRRRHVRGPGKAPIDLVILDVLLPREDGFSLRKRLRAFSRVPVIMLTAVTDHTDRTADLKLGADDYVTKPFNQRELLARTGHVAADRAWIPPSPCRRCHRGNRWLNRRRAPSSYPATAIMPTPGRPNRQGIRT
jgi:DNA-binding response OmpR family regulator